MGLTSARTGGTGHQEVRIVVLGEGVLTALAAGNVRDASRIATVGIPDWFVQGDYRRLWALRHRQLIEDPAAASWLTGAVVAVRNGATVGFAGYHGPPDELGMVEIGYEVDPAYRRQGYGHAVIDALLGRARQELGVRKVRATVSPYNIISRALLTGHGFEEAGQQWDERDGLEIIYEIGVAVV